MGKAAITLVGDGIENPANAQTMIDAAGMFGSRCLFRDRRNLAARWQEDGPVAEHEGRKMFLTYDDLSRGYSPIVACDNLEGAADVYSFRLPAGPQPAVVMGNERRGIGQDIQSLAASRVQIPMFARGGGKVNCLNVAAASAVALYYLQRGGGSKLQVRAHPSRRRPELMLVAGRSHVEVGSTIRSAGAFGWERILLEDRVGVWFGANRGVKAEGRSAARRHRNPIRLIPTGNDSRYAFREVYVVTTSNIVASIPLHRANLARGPQQLIVIPDESFIDVAGEDWYRLGKEVRFVHIDVPAQEYVYHYRLPASIALAEAGRQVGQREGGAKGARQRRQEPFYDCTINLLLEDVGETVYLEELELY